MIASLRCSHSTTRARGGRRPAPIALAIAASLALIGATACNPGQPVIVITSPSNGTFTQSGSVQVTGVVAFVEAEKIADVRVNGVSVLPLAVDNTFTATVPLDSNAIFQPIEAEMISTTGPILRDRITVILGPSIPDGQFSLQNIALRITEAGLDALEPLVTSLVDIDLATLIPPGTLVIDNYCYEDTFLGCLGRVDVLIDGNPPPSISSFGIDIDPMNGFMAGDILLNDLFVRAKVVAVSGIGFTCYIDINAATTNIYGDYGLSPLAGDPENVDVVQLGGVAVSFGSFSDSTDCDGFLGFVVEALISLFVGDIQDLMQPAFENFLNTADANGNTPTAGAIETALAGVEIAGPIGASLGLDLEAPLFTVDEDTGGLTLGSDARVTPLTPDPEAPDLTASFHVVEPFPVFGALSPSGFPYDVAMCIGTSAFNQVLKAGIESGLLRLSFTEFDFGTGPTPLTAGLLAILIPEFGFLDPTTPLVIEVAPRLAPILTGEPGGQGEIINLQLDGLQIDVLPAGSDIAFLSVEVGAELGLDVGLDTAGIVVTPGPITPGSIGLSILTNRMGSSEATISTLVPLLLNLAIPQITDTLGAFPLPSFLGLQLQLVEVDRNGEFLSLFLDLAP